MKLTIDELMDFLERLRLLKSKRMTRIRLFKNLLVMVDGLMEVVKGGATMQ